MYIVVSDYTNEKADIYKSVSIDKAFNQETMRLLLPLSAFSVFSMGCLKMRPLGTKMQ